MSKSNVIPFPRRRQQKAQSQSTAFETVCDFPAPTVMESADQFLMKQAGSAPKEALEKALDEHRATMLEQAHKRQAFEMQMMLENNTAQIKLEAMAYRALLAGVPESDIYDLGEDMAEALSSAMNAAAGA